MLAPRAARWVGERVGPGESAVYDSEALSPGPTLSPTRYAGLRPACQHARTLFVSSS